MGRGSGSGGAAGGRGRATVDVDGGYRARRTVRESAGDMRLALKSDGLGHVTTTLTHRGKQIGVAGFYVERDGQLLPSWVTVSPEHRRKGLGSQMYAATERITGRKIRQGQTQTDDGKAFSAAYRKKRDDT